MTARLSEDDPSRAIGGYGTREDRKLLEELKRPDVPEIPNIPGIIVDNASGWGNGGPRENRTTTGYVVDDHEEDRGVHDGLGSS